MSDHHDDAHRAGLATPERACTDHPGLAPLGAAGAAPAGLSPPQVGAPQAGGYGEGRGRGQGAADCLIFEQPDAQRKRVATLTARAALLGLALRQDGPAWCITKESGEAIALPSLQAAEAVVYGCELVRAEVGALVVRLARGQGVAA